MTNDFILSLETLFIVDPIETKIETSLNSKYVSAAVFYKVQSCLEVSPSEIIKKANSDWTWTIKTVVQITLAIKSSEKILMDVVPGCRAPLIALEPSLQR